MGLQGTLTTVDSLPGCDKDRMFDLMTGHFEGLDKQTFLRDLGEKPWVIVLRDGVSNQIMGFSTQMLLHVHVAGEPVWGLFSGDTIIDKNHWGETELIRLWGRFVLELMDQYAGKPLYWFLISMGYKTYRFLPVFFYEFYPRYETGIPQREQRILDSLASSKYPADYDPRSGVIWPAGRKVRLRPGIADVDERRRNDPHVRFFTEKNPDHAEGAELACIAPLTKKNLKPRAYAIIQRQEVQPAKVSCSKGTN